jgi:hypothetical protein
VTVGDAVTPEGVLLVSFAHSSAIISLPLSAFPPLAVGFFGLGTVYLIYGPQELFGFPRRDQAVDATSGIWGIWMPGFMQFITGTYLFLGLTLFHSFVAPALHGHRAVADVPDLRRRAELSPRATTCLSERTRAGLALGMATCLRPGMLECAPERHIWGPGRHFIGSNFTWYPRDPAGNWSRSRSRRSADRPLRLLLNVAMGRLDVPDVLRPLTGGVHDLQRRRTRRCPHHQRVRRHGATLRAAD